VNIKNNNELTLNGFLELPRKEIKRIMSKEDFFRGDFE